MRQQSTKWQCRIEKPLKFTGIWENFVPSNVPSIVLECLDPLLEKKKISISVPDFAA